MKTSLKLTLAQTLFTILLYALGAIILGVALYPSVLLVHFYWTHSAHLVDGQRLLFLCFTLAGGYFIFGLTLIFTASFARVLLGLHVKEGVHSVGSPQMLKWMMVSALYIAVRFIRLRRRPRALPVDECEKAFASARCSPKGKASGNPSADNPRRFDSRSESAGGKTRYHGLCPWGSIFLDFMLLTPFCALFYKLMGAKLGKNVQINSTRVGDISLLEIGDNSVIG